MLCCFGLFLGYAVGSMLGGPWTIIGPISGFILGLIGDMRLLRGYHKHHGGYGGGCCEGWFRQHDDAEDSAKDPVCSMQVNKRTAQYKADFNGKTYYFCSSACEAAFKKNPEMYAGCT